MADTSPSLKKSDHIIIISLLAFFLYLTLFQLRIYDDNRLTSWKWVFEGTDVSVFFFTLIAAIIAAYPLSRVTFHERMPGAVLFLFSFLISIFFYREPEVIVDASRYFTQAKHLEVYGLKYFIEEWGRDIIAWTDLPLIPMVYGLIFKLFGEARFFVQIFNSALFSFTLLLTFNIGKSLWDEETGFIAGALLLGMPYLYTQVPLMLIDVPTMFFLTLSVFTFIRALERGGSWTVVSSVSLFLVFFSKYSVWLMLSILGIIFLIFLIQSSGRRNHIVQRCITVAVTAGILIGAVFWYKYDLFSEQISFLQEYQKPGLKRWGESYLSTFFFQIHPFISIAALFSIYVAFKKRDIKYLVISWLVILFIILQIKRIRYTVPAFPMIALMASYGLQEIREKKVRRFLVSCVILSSLVLSGFFYLPFLQRMSAVNLKDAGRFLNHSKTDNVEVITLPTETFNINPAVSVPVLDIFTDKKLGFQYLFESISSDKIKESSLRFTWAYKNPGYYSKEVIDVKGDTMLVVISSESGQEVPEYIKNRTDRLSLVQVFDKSTGIFSYITEVRVYQ